MQSAHNRLLATLGACALAASLVGGFSPPAPAAATEDPEVSIGVMRYDSKNPTPLANQYTSSFNALEDPTWNDHGYWPFFAETDSSGALVELNENTVEIAEQENQYAAEAGVDYWAFLHAADYETDPSGGIYSAQFQRYLESSNRSDVKFAWILNYHTFTTEDALDEAIDYIISEQDDYFRVLDGRPLVYIYPNGVPDNSDLPTTIPHIRNRLQAANLPNPYIVLFNRSGEGEDATSDYASRSDDDVTGENYDSYIERVNREWSDPNEDADYVDKNDGRTGQYRLVHWKASDYSVRTEQLVQSLTAGTYTLSAYVKTSGSIGDAALTASGCSTTDQSVAIPAATSTYTQVTLTNINVTGSTCRIGISSDGNPAQEWMVVDDVSFTSDAAPSTNLVTNPGFESSTGGATTVQAVHGWETFGPLEDGAEYVPNAPLNWDNRPFALNPPPWGTGPNHWNLPPTAEQYREMMQSAVNWVLENQETAPALTVVSKEWNGMEEGGNIAPSLRYGARYLDAIRAVNKGAITTNSPPDEVPQDVLSYQVYNHGGTAFKWVFQPFSSEQYTIQAGDYLEYDVKLLHPHAGAGSVELRATDDTYIFDSTATDQNNLDAQAWEDLSDFADGEWYHRKIPLPQTAVGKTIAYWLAASESQGSDSADRTTRVLYDNVTITNGASDVRRVIFGDSTDGSIGDYDTASGASAHMTYVDEVGSRGQDLLSNGGFESGTGGSSLVQSPAGWDTAGDSAANYAQQGSSDAKSGDYRGVHWSSASYAVTTQQTASDLDDGRYTLTAWVKSSSNPGDAHLFAEDCGGDERKVAIPSGASTWTKLRIPGIEVNGGECTVGVRSDSAPATQWIAFDDIELREDAANLVDNPGFEDGTASASIVQSPASWSTTGADADADFAELGSAEARSGNYRAVHEKGTAYNVTTSQTISDLTQGHYTLTAWTYAPEFLGTATANVTCGSSSKSFSIPYSRIYQQIRIENVPVTGTTCTIAFESEGSEGGKGFSIDDVSFYRQ